MKGKLSVRRVNPLLCSLCGKPQEFVISYWDKDNPGPMRTSLTGHEYATETIFKRACRGCVVNVTAGVLMEAGLYAPEPEPIHDVTVTPEKGNANQK